MGDEIEHNCGVVVGHTLHDTYSFLKSVNHRGRDAAGIVAIGDDRIDVLKWLGTVDSFDITDLHKIFPRQFYHTYGGHVRYATRGSKNRLLDDAHPHTIGGRVEDRGSHIIVRGAEMAAWHNGQADPKYFEGIDRSRLKTECDTEGLLHLFKAIGEQGILQRVPGSYVLAVADKRRKDVVALVDRHGIKPGTIGWKDGNYGMSSESVSFRDNGGKIIEEMDSGTAYYFQPDGGFRKEKFIDAPLRRCMFDFNYILGENSVLGYLYTHGVRQELGKALGKEHHPQMDSVLWVPRCSEPAAHGYSKVTGVPVVDAFYKMKSERSFQGATAEERAKSIDQNLFLLPGIENKIKDKAVGVIDDSIVRGNVARRVKHLLYEVAGVKEVHLMSYTPKVGIRKNGVDHGCLYGVDMPPTDNFIARGKTDQQISDALGMETYFLSVNGLLEAFERMGINRESLCYHCIGGSKPFK